MKKKQVRLSMKLLRRFAHEYDDSALECADEFLDFVEEKMREKV